MKTRHAKTVPAGDNKNCTSCKKILMDGEPAYFMNRDSLGRGNHKCITCFNGEPIPLKDHPLASEVFAKLRSGEIVAS